MMSIFCLRFKNLTKLILSVLFILSLSSINFASDISEQISEAQCITEYSDDTDIEDMDTVTFGSYPQSSSNSKEPIEWIVLDKQGDKALLLSKYILDYKCYNEVYKDVTWETCTLRQWLINDFYNTAFNENDRQQILQVNTPETSMEKKEFSGKSISPKVIDKVFFLSINECEKYFLVTQSKNGRLTNLKRGAITEATNYANSKFDFNFDVNSYWLRTHLPVFNDDGHYYDTFYVNITIGTDEFSELVSYYTRMSEGSWEGVRPAIWVSLSNSNSNSNSNSAGYVTEEGWIKANPDLPIVEIKKFDKDKADKATVTRSAWEQLPEDLKSQFREDQIIDDVSNNVQETTKPAPKNGWDGDYYYQNDVPVKNTWVDYGSDKYYCGSSGAILKNQWIDSTYYVDNTGKMLKNTTTPDGNKVDANGKRIKEIETKAPETKTPKEKSVNENDVISNLTSQIARAKSVNEYSKDTTVEHMDTVTFGSYPQSDASGNTKEPIEWIVLEKNGDKALLLSKYVIDKITINEDRNVNNINWDNSSLRTWLNNDFYSNSFNDTEKQQILTTNLSSNNFILRNTNFRSISSNDKVFCLSIREIDKYFSGNLFKEEQSTFDQNISKKIEIINTNYANSKFSMSPTMDTFLLRDYSDTLELAAIAIYHDESYHNPEQYELVFHYFEYDTGLIHFGVRPAIWVNTSNTQTDNTSKTTTAETKVQETKAKETKPQETKVKETKPQETTQPAQSVFDNVHIEGADIIQKADGTLQIGGVIEDGDVILKKGNDNGSSATNDNYYNISLTKDDIKSVNVKEEKQYFLFFVTGTEYKLNIYLTDAGNRKLKEASERNLGQSLYLVCDGKLLIDFKVDKVYDNNEGISVQYSSKEQAQDRMSKINGAKSVYLVEGDYQSFINNENSASISKNSNNKNKEDDIVKPSGTRKIYGSRKNNDTKEVRTNLKGTYVNIGKDCIKLKLTKDIIKSMTVERENIDGIALDSTINNILFSDDKTDKCFIKIILDFSHMPLQSEMQEMQEFLSKCYTSTIYYDGGDPDNEDNKIIKSLSIEDSMVFSPDIVKLYVKDEEKAEKVIEYINNRFDYYGKSTIDIYYRQWDLEKGGYLQSPKLIGASEIEIVPGNAIIPAKAYLKFDNEIKENFNKAIDEHKLYKYLVLVMPDFVEANIKKIEKYNISGKCPLSNYQFEAYRFNNLPKESIKSNKIEINIEDVVGHPFMNEDADTYYSMENMKKKAMEYPYVMILCDDVKYYVK